MDIQRTGLLAILGILTYVLFLQWNRYTEINHEVTQVAAVQPSTLSQSKPTNEIPSTNNRLETPVTSLKSTAGDDYLLISTPITDITIDLTGGDIIQVLLKNYPVSLNDPDNPIALLDMLNRTYVAQSGLVGTDGPDAASNGRPVYHAEQDKYFSNDTET